MSAFPEGKPARRETELSPSRWLDAAVDVIERERNLAFLVIFAAILGVIYVALSLDRGFLSGDG